MLGFKVCSKCKETKNLYEFSLNRRNKSTMRQPKCKSCNNKYYSKNQEKTIVRVRNWYYENHDERLRKRRELAKRPEAKEKKSQQDKRYYKKNKEQISKYHKEWSKENRSQLNEYYRKWYTDNLEHARLSSRTSSQKRRCSIYENGNNTLTLEEVKKLFVEHPYCEYCGKNNKEVELVIDHIIPISKGGQNCIDNVVPACQPCNSSKSNKLLSEWLNS